MDISREPETSPGLSPAQQKRLLQIARTAIEHYLAFREVAPCAEEDEALLQPAGAFVTLREIDGVRGCVGMIRARGPLCIAVRDMAIAAACQDPRCRPVTREELPELAIEISVLSPLRRVSSPDEIDVNFHGVVVESGGNSGVFLPQVARSHGWTRDVLLDELCEHKAGLPPGAWKRGAALYTFTVQEIHE